MRGREGGSRAARQDVWMEIRWKPNLLGSWLLGNRRSLLTEQGRPGNHLSRQDSSVEKHLVYLRVRSFPPQKIAFIPTASETRRQEPITQVLASDPAERPSITLHTCPALGTGHIWSPPATATLPQLLGGRVCAIHSCRESKACIRIRTEGARKEGIKPMCFCPKKT